jgi:NAD(P)-dependent dehydrogenase (short-subunit alcohol dehydrogenase family)
MSRNVVVTGASRGIGAAVSHAFATQGNKVAVHYSASPQAATSVFDGLPGSGHLLIQADLRDETGPAELMQAVLQEWSQVDVLINNAGVVHRVAVTDEDSEAWRAAWVDTIQVNVMAPAMLTWHVVRHMPAGGRIVNIGSRAAFRGMPDSVMYASSKAALAAMTQSLAQALGPKGIAVTAVAPGYTSTDMGRLVLDGPDGAGLRAQSPFNRVATPAEVAHAVLFLADPQSEWAAGAILDLNGASHLRM